MSQGFSEQRLGNIQNFVKRYVEDGRLPGYLCLVSRYGGEARSLAHGAMDIEREKPMTRDTIFRIYSMSKPITSVALMMLYEQGHFQLDDPVARYIPAWKDLKVYVGGDGAVADMEVSEPLRAMTIKDLFTHTSGLTYGFMNSHPVDAVYRANEIGGMAVGGTLEEMVTKLADIPLQFTPGSQWNYSVSTDVLGYLVQLFSGRDLDEYVAERITSPLGMADTGFMVPANKLERFAACYERVRRDDSFRLQDDPEQSSYLKRPTFFSGGGGMVSSLDDYHQFTKMLLGRGELAGVRLLGRKTVEYMTRNHMPGNCDLAAMGQPVFSETPYEGIGFGLGFSVVVDPAAANVLDSPGEFAWGGAASTYFWIDPLEELIVIFMTQLLPSSSYPIRRQLKTLVYQALVD
ncbi:MAG: beta-lactamase family protein [Gammaproteobacteria bacterium]|nr:beta-lactamase family protein [Gammaproteobacteria bacterium]